MDLKKPRGNRHGVCKLCGQTGDLEESHIVPSFAYRWLKGSAAMPYMRHGATPNRRVQDGFKRYWLCRSCEEIFNRLETTFANSLFYPYHGDPTIRVAYDDWLLRFCVSISWRVLSLFQDEGHLSTFPKQFEADIQDALAAWKAFLLGSRSDLGEHEEHLIPWSQITSADKSMPVNINRYLLRSIDIDVVEDGETAFVYSKLGALMILGFIKMKKPQHWDGGTRLGSSGVIEPRHYGVPMSLGKYVFNQARGSRAKVVGSLSEAQKEKIRRDFRNNMDRAVKSETFRAVDADVRLFGDRAFDVDEDPDKEK